MKNAFTVVSSIFLLLLSTLNCFALNEETHATLNYTIIENKVGKDLDDYLKTHTRLDDGVNTLFNNKKVIDWIRDGGIYEDSRPVPLIHSRSFMHFHDPTMLLEDAGFKGDIAGILKKEWDSSIIWALSDNGQSSLNLSDYSWPTVREYFYQALTATDADEQEDNYADTFRGIGQLMHLVEDASVPAHTRNEGHPFDFHYEVWVHSIQDDTLFDDLIKNPVDVYSTLLSQPGMPEFGGNPVSRLFDTDRYNEDNPDVTTGNDIGIAEYTNANFFSRATAMDYDYPKKAEMTEALIKVLNPDYPKDPDEYIFRYYYSKDGDGEPVEHLASISYVE